MLWMQVSTVTARISNILLIKSLLVARLANHHSCVTAGAQTAPKCCSWLHPTELIIYQRGAPVLTLSNPPSGRGFFFPLPESEREKNLMVNIDLTNTPPPPKKKKIQKLKFHLSALRHTSVCICCRQRHCRPSYIIPVAAARINRKHSAVLIVDKGLYIQLSSSGASLRRA